MRVRLAWISVVFLCVAGGATKEEAQKLEATDLPLNLRGATGDLAEWLKGFDHPVERFGYTVSPLGEEDDFRILQVTYPSPMKTPFPENDVVPGELYVPAHPALGADGRMPAAIVLDILDGRAILPRMTARVLAQRGVAAFYFPMPFYNSRRPPANAHQKLLEGDPGPYLAPPPRQLVMDVRRAKAILASRPEIDPHRIGITGISLGGIMTSLAAGVDGEFYRVAPVLAGGDMATLIFHTREMRSIRQVLERHGIDRDATAKLLAPVEPLNFASRIDPGTCMMINAAQDEVIPRAATLGLAEAMGKPTLLWLPGGHYSGMLYLPIAQQKVADWMLGVEVRSLEMKPGAKPARTPQTLPAAIPPS